ncbi:MAG TPA: HEAT repeat domain-containing protein [Lacipirellula sp.]
MALALLQARGACTSEFVVEALEDSSSDVRERALCIAEQHCDEPRVAAAILHLAQDPSPRVRYQAALSSMFLPSRQAISALQPIARLDHTDEWACRALALASREQASELLLSLLSGEDDLDRSVLPGLLRELAGAVAVVGGKEQVAAVLCELPYAHEREARAILLAFAAALETRGSDLAAAMTAFEQSSPQAHAELLSIFDRALAIVANPQATDGDRIAACQLLAIFPRPETLTPLLTLVRERSTPPALKLAALDALRRQADGDVAEQLIASLPEQLPSVRRGIVELLTSQPKWAAELLAAAELDPTIADEIDPARRAMLVEHYDAAVRDVAQRLFGAAMQDRQEVVSRYRQSLTLAGDAERGRQVFVANCASCHRLNGEGTAVGPDIGDSSMKSSAQLLADILDPNRAIDANYVSYTALTVDGLAHQGLIRSETDGGIVLLGGDGKTVTVLRDELESLTSGKSLMPEGLEQQISRQQMADLLMYLKTWRHAEDLRGAGDNHRE